MDEIEHKKCLCIHALDGYETYAVDDNKIGVRPIWYDIESAPEDKTNILGYSALGSIHIIHFDGKFHNMSECDFTHWMHLPKPPKQGQLRGCPIFKSKEGEVSHIDDFISDIKEYINYWDSVDDKTSKEKLQGLAFSILCILDGVATFEGDINTIANECQNCMLHDHFYESKVK